MVPEPAWLPGDTADTNLAWLMRRTGIDDIAALHAWSVAEPDAFWGAMVARLGVRFQAAPERVWAPPRWLPGARYNLVESCFQAPDDSPAIVFQPEDGALETVTVAQLRARAARVAHGLAALGLPPGARIAADMALTPDAVALLLGALATGHPVVTIPESFAAPEIALRLRIGDPALVVVHDTLPRNRARLPLYEKLCAADAPRAVVVPASGAISLPLRAGDLAWDDFLSERTDLQSVERGPDDHTVLLFSSGTTGAPKAIPWDQTTPLKGAIDAHLHHDVRPGDTLCWPTSLGWMMGPWLVFAALLNRATIALYGGAPTSPGFGEFVERSGATLLGVVPSLVSAWRGSGAVDAANWSGLRVLSSTGECSNPDDMRWLMGRAGGKPVIEYCGGTEIGGGYITGTVLQPAVPGCFTTPALGSALTVLGDDGSPAERGEVFLIPPALGLSRELLGADHDRVYFDGAPLGPDGRPLRRHGDRMERLPGGYWRALGRADDAMNLGGIKVGAVELEAVAGRVAGVRECAAVAVAPPGGGPARLVFFAVADRAPAALKGAIQAAIRAELNPLFKVHDVVPVERLPRTASNKIVRRALRDAYDR